MTKELVLTKGTGLLGYLHQMTTWRRDVMTLPDGFKYASHEELVLTEGKEGCSEPFTPDEETTLLKLLTAGPHRAKECYYNALKLVMEAEGRGIDVQYTEGFGSGIIPVLHAWVTLNGKPVDVTWGAGLKDRTYSPSKLLERVKANLQENEYHGISFDNKEIIKRALREGKSFSVIDDFENRQPLLRTGKE